MADPAPKTNPTFGTFSPEQSAAFDAKAAQIMGGEGEKPPAEEEPFDVGSVEPRQGAPAEARDSSDSESSEVDEDALEEAYEAFRRDKLSQEEIEARLGRLGARKFISAGQKRAKKHRADDEAHTLLKALRQERGDTKGATEPEKKGERSQASAPALNLEAVVGPLAEQLALSDEGKKTLVASFEAAVKAKEGEILTLKEHQALIAGVLNDILQEGVRKEVGLDQLDDDDWFAVQETYQELLRTNLHGDLAGKPRMKALLKAAAKLAGVKVPEPEEIQRKASIASAKAKGAPVIPRQRRLPDKPMTPDEVFDHVGKLVTSGKFRGQPPSVVREYADALRRQSKK